MRPDDEVFFFCYGSSSTYRPVGLESKSSHVQDDPVLSVHGGSYSARPNRNEDQVLLCSTYKQVNNKSIGMNHQLYPQQDRAA